ncbi:MAG: serine/threonine protein kinase [Gemmatimonadales bacterium]|nr:MAG: serine/threonine protein kinase [Gemmatimonadales bacterium]
MSEGERNGRESRPRPPKADLSDPPASGAGADEADEYFRGLSVRMGGLFHLEGEGGPELPERLGPYRVLRFLGEGGMGSVYLACREDREFEMKVALKLLHPYLALGSFRRRFRAERQILADLSHPGIASLIDGGVLPGQVPYLAMEYIEGDPIDQWCDARELSVRNRVRLFLQVLEAVSHAHSRLVIHRDLKPGNILVTFDGKVKLLDFGVATVVKRGAVEADRRIALNLDQAERPLTPTYSSPEELRGEPVSAASDVYSLGVLLHTLLVGAAPSDFEGSSVADLLSPVHDFRVTPPSVSMRRLASVGSAGPGGSPWTAIDAARKRGRSPRGLARELAGDLDLIVEVALHPDPAHRYSSVDQLSEDLKRWLDRLPVRARPPTRRHRLALFVARHRAGAMLGSLAAILLVAITGLSLHWSVELRQFASSLEDERNRAQSEARRADASLGFLQDAFALADPSETGGEDVTARQILETAEQQVYREMGAHPEVQAELLSVMAEVYIRLGLSARAESLADDAIRLRELSVPGDAAGLLRNELQRALAWRNTGRSLEERQEELGRMVEVSRGVHGSMSPETALILRHYGNALRETDTREAAFQESLSIYRSLAGDWRAEIATTLLSSTHGLLPLPDREERIREALRLRIDVLGEDHRQVGTAYSDLALYLEPTDPVAAIGYMQTALEIHRGAAGPHHTTTLTLLNNLAGLHRDQGQWTDAEPLYREVLAARRLLQPDEAVRLAYPKYGLGFVLLEMGGAAEAVPLLAQVEETFGLSDGRGRAAAIGLARGQMAIEAREAAQATARRLQAAAIEAGDTARADAAAELLVELLDGGVMEEVQG